VKETELELLGYLLAIAGGGLIGVAAALAIGTAIEILGPQLRRYLDRKSDQMWKDMEKQAGDTASALTSGVVSLIYGQQALDALAMMDTDD
jgi:hypothetical protein